MEVAGHLRDEPISAPQGAKIWECTGIGSPDFNKWLWKKNKFFPLLKEAVSRDF